MPTEDKVVQINGGRTMSAAKLLTNWNLGVRELLARFQGGFGQKRDLYNVFGWDRAISTDMMVEMYHRGGIAERAVNAYPDAIWARPPLIYDDVEEEEDPFTTKWASLAEQAGLWDVLRRADILARLGRYSVILVGTDKNNMSTELKGASEITYMQPYSELAAKVSSWEIDPNNVRFGLPKTYRISPDMGTQEKRTSSLGYGSGGSAVPGRRPFEVHHSRIIHIAHGVIEDLVYGVPVLGSIWNYLTDLQKVVGGSAESYWLTANRGLQIDVDKDLQMSDEDAAALSQEAEEYSDQMRRILRTRGVNVKDLGSRVADPRGPFGVLVQLISGTLSIPQRVLLGSESGHLASTQDKGNWAEQIENHRALVSEPRILMAVLECFMNGGLLPEPKGQVWVEWPDAFRPTPLERGEIASKTALAFNNLALGAKTLQNLLDPREMRAIIGFASDNRLLLDVPLTLNDDALRGKRDADVTEPKPAGFGAPGGQPGDGTSGGPAQAVGTPKANARSRRKHYGQNKNARPLFVRKNGKTVKAKKAA